MSNNNYQKNLKSLELSDLFLNIGSDNRIILIRLGIDFSINALD